MLDMLPTLMAMRNRIPGGSGPMSPFGGGGGYGPMGPSGGGGGYGGAPGRNAFGDDMPIGQPAAPLTETGGTWQTGANPMAGDFPLGRPAQYPISETTAGALSRHHDLDNLTGLFSAAEQEYDLPPGYLARIAYVESRGDPNALHPDSRAAGIFQFVPRTAGQFNLDNPYDVSASTRAVGEFTAQNAAGLQSTLGRAPTAAELYLAHQQGLGGARALLSNPSARAADVLGSESKVILNGGRVDMTAAEFADHIMNKQFSSI